MTRRKRQTYTRYHPIAEGNTWRINDRLSQRTTMFGFRAKRYETQEECETRCQQLVSDETRMQGHVAPLEGRV